MQIHKQLVMIDVGRTCKTLAQMLCESLHAEQQHLIDELVATAHAAPKAANPFDEPWIRLNSEKLQ